MPVIQWLLDSLLPGVSIEGFSANQEELPSARDLAGRIVTAVKLRPCEILFVHRDADTAGRDSRIREIERAVLAARSRQATLVPIVPVIPARMIETWLLTDGDAIRRTAGNPNGPMPTLPRLRDLERLANPKDRLNSLMLTATGLRPQRQRRFDVNIVAVAEETMSFAPLRQLPAFRAFEADVRQTIADRRWPANL